MHPTHLPDPTAEPPQAQETPALLDRIASGDRAAMSRLLELHRSEIREVVNLRISPSLRARVDGSDVAQEALVDASLRMEEFLAERPMPFRWWIRKLALQQLGKARTRHITATKRSLDREQRFSSAASNGLSQHIAANQLGPGSAAVRREMTEHIHEAIAQLKPIEQEILLMRYFEKLTNAQIGYLLEMTAEAVSKRHARCLLRLRKVMDSFLDDSAVP